MFRKLFISFGVIALVGLIGMAGARAASIVNTDHDLSSLSGGTTTEVCVFCHTPHNTADPATLPVPLWNRLPSTTASFQMYSSASLDMTIAGQPQGVSLACLSCHDGVTAYNALANDPGITTTPTQMGNGENAVGFGGDLTNDHPISITYDPTADPDFFAAASGKIGGQLPLYRAPGVTVGFGDQVECASCHNPHDPQYPPFLRVANTASALCTACHNK